MFNIDIREYQVTFAQLIFVLFNFSCVSNYEPVISEITAYPNPVNLGELVFLRCIANDEDLTNILDKDLITYDWSASAGSFIVPDTVDTLYGISDLSYALDSIDSVLHPSKIYWVPFDSSGVETDTGYQTITCQVSDENNAIDILSILIKVQ